MKKTFLKIFAFALILTSCSNEEIVNDNSAESKDLNLEKADGLLPSRIVVTTVDEDNKPVSYTDKYTYDGNKLASSLNDSGTRVTYKYVGNNITLKTYFDTKQNNIKLGTQKISYSSTNEPIKSVINLKSFTDGKESVVLQILNFDYSTKNQVTIKGVTKQNGKITAKFTEVEKLLNGNVIESLFFYDGKIESDGISQFDNKKSPFANVVGNKRFFGPELEGGVGAHQYENNRIKYTDDKGKIYSTKIEFNNNGLPTKFTETGGDDHISKIFYK
jgi:hypothetical protein